MISRITVKKYLGDDRASWAIFLDGRAVITGLTKDEVPYYKKQILKNLKRYP